MTNFANKTSVSRSALSEHIKKTRRAEKSKAESDNFLENNYSSGGGRSSGGIGTLENIFSRNVAQHESVCIRALGDVTVAGGWFPQVRVTKKSGDGRIKLHINGIFSFNVAFQCKRYTGSVAAGDIRNFRGLLTTDIEKGICITTGSFTHAARKEALNAGKQQIDLFDGEEFIDKLIEYRLDVTEKTIYFVDKRFGKI